MYCLKFQCFERIGKYDLSSTKLMLQCFRKKLKIKQNYRTMSLMLVQILFYLLLLKVYIRNALLEGVL